MLAKLTVVIPTLNEEQDLPRCLDSIQDLADEIIVIDSGSQDHTLAIAKKYGAQIFSHPFKSFSDTRNYGDSVANKDWILSIEADVTLTPELVSEIKNATQDSTYSAFYLERINIIWGKPIMHSDWGPKDDAHIWLYRKGAGQWVSEVHEEYQIQKPTGRLKSRLVHHNYDTVNEFIEKIDRYSEIAKTQSRHVSWLSPVCDFCKRYFYKKGFLDGYHGLFLSYLQGVYYTTLLVKTKTS